MKLEELQTILSILECKSATEATLVSRLKELVITRYPNELGTLQMSNFEVTIKLE